MKAITKKEISSCLGTVAYIITLLIIGIGIVWIISSKTYEENGFKDTGLKTSDGYRLQYNENTNLVYTASLKIGQVGFVYLILQNLV